MLIIDAGAPDAPERAAAWVRTQKQRFGPHMALGIGGPRESEAPGIYAKARLLVAAVLDRLP
jgi:hypothetical protein